MLRDNDNEYVRRLKGLLTGLIGGSGSAMNDLVNSNKSINNTSINQIIGNPNSLLEQIRLGKVQEEQVKRFYDILDRADMLSAARRHNISEEDLRNFRNYEELKNYLTNKKFEPNLSEGEVILETHKCSPILVNEFAASTGQEDPIYKYPVMTNITTLPYLVSDVHLTYKKYEDKFYVYFFLNENGIKNKESLVDSDTLQIIKMAPRTSYEIKPIEITDLYEIEYRDNLFMNKSEILSFEVLGKIN